jgi:serine/threonine protein kinase
MLAQPCPACFEPAPADEGCLCGYDVYAALSPLVLPPGTRLTSGAGRDYDVGLVLGAGGFGITYLGRERGGGERLAIKEYLPRDQAGRAPNSTDVRPHTTEAAACFEYGLTRFLQEAQLLQNFSHQNVVAVRDVFQTNQTAYLVMPYYEGRTLGSYVETRGRLAPGVAVAVMMSVLDGLRHVHEMNVNGRRWMHRDVKPDNIFLAADRSPILIDFGASRAEVGERSKDLSVVLTPGFAPYEQYFSTGRAQGPWVDVYGAAATLYAAVTGTISFASAPERQDAITHGEPDPLIAPDELVRDVPRGLSTIILKGMAVGYRERPQDAKEFQALLKAGEASSFADIVGRLPDAPCPSCKKLVRQGARYCKFCGHALAAQQRTLAADEKTCPACRSRVRRGATFCNRCGNRFT